MAGIEELLERLGDDPTDAEALARFTGACLEHDDHERLLAGYERVVDALPPERWPHVAASLARQLEARARDAPDRDAAEFLLRAASLWRLLDQGSGQTAVATALSSAWRRFPDRRVVEQAWEVLGGPPLEEAPDALLVARSQVAPPQTRRVVLGALADRWMEAGRDDDARAVLQELAELAPDDPEVTRRLEALAPVPGEEVPAEPPPPAPPTPRPRRPGVRTRADTAHEDEGAARATVRELKASLEDASPALEVVLRRRLFQRLREDLEAPEEAAEALRFPAEVPEGAREALQRAKERAEAGDPEQAVALLSDAARATTDQDEQVPLLLEAARLLEAVLDDAEGAEKAYRRLRIVDPMSLPVLTFYRDWYAERDEPRRAYATLSQLHGALEGPELAGERIGVALEMADLADSELDSRDKAIEAWRRVLADDPLHEQANEELRRLYAETKRWHALADHLDTWVRRLPPDAVDRKVELLFDLIGIYQDPERLPMDDMVIATYQRIVALAPTDRTALDSLARRYEDRERWTDLVEVLSRKVELTADPAELLDLFGRIADLYLERIRSDTEAIPVLERILELDPGHIDVIRRLRQIHRRRHDSERLYATYQRELSLLEGPERLDVLVELATLATEELFHHDEAIAWWRDVLAIDPSHARALEALQELTAEQQDWPGYVRLLEQRLEGAITRKKRVEILQELGEVLHGRLGDEDRALEIFAEICELSPFNSRARHFLQRIYAGRRAWEDLRALYVPREDWKGYAAMLRDFARETDDPELSADVHREIARTESELLGAPARAWKSLLAGLQAAPHRVDLARLLLDEHGDRLGDDPRSTALETVARHGEAPAEQETAWRELAELRARQGDDVGARDAWGQALLLGAESGRVDALGPFEEAAAAVGDWEEVARVLGEALGRLPDDGDQGRVALYRSLGALHRRHLGDPSGAVTHYRWVLQLQPGDAESLDALEEIHLSRHDFEGLEEVLRLRAEEAARPEEARAARRRLGQLYEDVFTDLEAAAAVYQRLLDQDPDDAEALTSLERVLAMDEAWPELAAALEDVLPHVASPARQASVALDLARLYRERVGDPGLAAERLRDLLEHPEADRAEILGLLEEMLEGREEPEAVAPILEQHYRAEGDDADLARVLEVRLGTSALPDERLALARELATLYEERLGDAAGAFRARAAAFRLDPDDQETWSELERLAEPAGGWEDLAALWRAAVDEDAGPETPRPSARDDRDALRIALARILRERLDAEDEAIRLYEAVLSQPERLAAHPEVVEDLDALYEARGDDEALAALRLAAAEHVLEGAERRRRLLEACDLLAGPLGRLEEAVGHWERLVREDPSDDTAARHLETGLEELGRWDDLEALLTQRMEGQEAPERVDRARLRRAFVRLEELGRTADGVEDLLALAPSEAVGADARDVLLDLAGRDDVPAALRLRILDDLDAHFEATGDAWGRSALLEVRASGASSAADRARFLAEAGRALAAPEQAGERLAEDEAAVRRAFGLYARSLETAPGQDEPAEAMEALARARGALDELLERLSAIADGCVRPGPAATIRGRVARLAERDLGEPERAIEAWRGVAEAGAGVDAKLREEALDALDRLLGEVGRPEERVDVLLHRAELTPQPSVRLGHLKDAAGLLHDLGRIGDAVDALRKILWETRATRRPDLLAERETATAHLETLLGEAGRHEELVDLLVDGADAFGRTEAARRQLHRAAEVAERDLEDRPRAISILERVRDLEPLDGVALERLDRLYQEEERWEDKARLLESRLEVAEEAGDEEARRTLLFTLGQIRDNRLDDPTGAVAAYEAILAREPGFPPARAALEARPDDDPAAPRARLALADAYRRTEEPEPLARTLEAALAAGDAPDEASALRTELVGLFLGPLDTPERGWAQAADRLRAEPDDLDARDLAVRAGLAAGGTGDLVELLADVALGLPDAGSRSARLESDLEALRGEGLDTPRLLPLWRALLDVAPAHEEATDVLEQHAREVDDHEGLIGILERREDVTEDPERQRALRMERGELLASLPGRQMDAALVFEAVVTDDPADTEAFERLAALYRDLERWFDLADLLELRLGVLEEPTRRVAVLRELATLAAGPLDDPDRAVSLLGEVLDIRPGDPEAVATLEEMWGEGVEREPIFRLLEPTYEATEDWDKLVALYTSTLEEEGRTDLQLECLRKVARIELEELGDPHAAFDSTKALVARADEPEEHLEDLEALADRLDAWDDLAEFYEDLVADGRATPELIRRLAGLMRDRVGDVDRAAQYYRVALERAPDDREARDALTRLLTGEGRWRELVRHLEQGAEASLGMDEKIALYGEAADVLAERLDAPGEAATILRRVLDMEPTDRTLAERIATLLEAAGDRAALHDHYDEWIRHADEETAAEVRMRLVASELRSTETADDGLGQVRALLDSDDRRDAAVRVLEDFLGAPEHAGPEWRGPVHEAADLLADALGDDLSPGQEAALAGARLRVTEDADERLRHLEKLARLYAGPLDDSVAAAETWERLLAEHPGHREAQARLADHYRETGAPAEEARALENLLATESGDPDEASALRRRLAVLRMDALDDPDGALGLLEHELPGAARDPDLRTRLEHLYGAEGVFAGLVAVYDAALEDPDLDEATRLELLAKKAQIAETRLGDLDAARAACRALLDLEPRHGFALTALERIERRREDWAAVDEALGRRLAATEDEDARADLLVERAMNAVDRLESPEDALAWLREAEHLVGGGGAGPDRLVQAWQRLLREDATRLEAAHHLEPRCEAREDWRGLVSVLAMRMASAEDPEDRLALARRMARLTADRIGEPAAGLRTLLGVFPDHAHRREVRDDVERLAEASGRWEDAAIEAEKVLGREDDVDRVRELGLWLGRIQRGRLEDAAGAIRSYERVLAVDELNQEAMEALEGLYRRQESWRDVRRLLDARLATVADADRWRVLEELAQLVTRQEGPGAALSLWRELLWERPQDEEARKHLEEMLADRQTTAEAAEVLEPLYRKEGSWEALARLLEHRIDATEDAALLAQLHARAADLYDTRLDDEKRAFEHYAGALEGRPDDVDLLRRLERIAHKQARWTELAEALDRVVPHLSDDARAVEVLLHAAQIHELKAGKPDRAVDTLRRVLELEPEHRAALTGLHRLYEASGDRVAQLEMAARLARVAPEPAQAVPLWAEVRDLAEGLDEEDLLAGACRALLDHDPEDADTADRLLELHEASGRHEALASLLRERLEHERDPARVASLHARLGRVREAHLDDVGGAVRAYARALDHDPSRDDARDALERLYRDREDWSALYGLLAERAERVAESGEAEALWLELGTLAEERLDDPSEAVRAYERALDHAPHNPVALAELVRLCRRTGRREDLARYCVRRARVTDDRDERLALLAEAAELFAGPLEAPDEAEALLGEVLEDAPDHMAAMRALARLRDAEGRHEEAVGLLEQVAERAEGPERVDALVALGRILRESLDRPHDALKALQEARDMAPDDPTLTEALRDLFERTGSWEELGRILERDYEAAGSADERCDRALALARLHREHLGDDEGFRAWIDRAREARRDSPEVAEALAAFHEAREEWDLMAPQLEWLVNYLQGKKLMETLPQRAHDLGRLFERLDEPTKALEYYKTALHADGTFLPNLLDYGRLLVERERWDPALRVHQNLLMQRHKLSGSERADVLHRLAVASEALGDEAKARQYLKRLLSEAPDHPGAADLQARLG
ncbi:MAG: tetratricopeptide repeat protein [Myxococcota bacterium]